MQVTFTDEELKQQLFCELLKEEDGPNGPGFVRFGGFFRSEVLMRARETRRLYGIFQHYNKVLGDRMRMSDYLTFLASLFREIEDQSVVRENPCAEIPLRGFMDRTNLRAPLEDHEAGCAINHPAPDSTPHCDCAFGRQ